MMGLPEVRGSFQLLSRFLSLSFHHLLTCSSRSRNLTALLL
jgi:hypothetical protein